jgi:hypothetical protein
MLFTTTTVHHINESTTTGRHHVKDASTRVKVGQTTAPMFPPPRCISTRLPPAPTPGTMNLRGLVEMQTRLEPLGMFLKILLLFTVLNVYILLAMCTEQRRTATTTHRHRHQAATSHRPPTLPSH